MTCDIVREGRGVDCCKDTAVQFNVEEREASSVFSGLIEMLAGAAQPSPGQVKLVLWPGGGRSSGR